jgi:hypothetical protein
LLPEYHGKSDIQCNNKSEEHCDRSQREYKKGRTEDINYSLPKPKGLPRGIRMIYINYVPKPGNTPNTALA